MFKDRKDAGQRLGAELEKFRDQNPLILAIPRGGVEVGYEVAEYLGAEMSIVVSRKLPYPDSPEAGFGAITEDGSRYIFSDAAARISWAVIEWIIIEQKTELDRRVQVLRGGEPLCAIEGRTVILVDDGIAMGSTMRVSIMLCRDQKAGYLVVAAPVAGLDTVREIAKLVDEIVVLECPRAFYAVAQVYENWYDVGDDEAIRILRKHRVRKSRV